MAALPPIILDDRLLIEELLVGLSTRQRRGPLHTTAYWYFRACRAAVLGGRGHVSGPLEGLGSGQREAAILSLLELGDAIALPDPRATVPAMARMAGRHPRLNLLNLEAAAAAQLLSATVWLSAESAAGVLPSVLDAEGVTWRTISIS